MLDNVQKYAVMGMLADGKDIKEINEVLGLSSRSRQVKNFLDESSKSHYVVRAQKLAVRLLEAHGIDIQTAFNLVNDNFGTRDVEEGTVELVANEVYREAMKKSQGMKLFGIHSDSGNSGPVVANAATSESGQPEPDSEDKILPPTSEDIFVIPGNGK